MLTMTLKNHDEKILVAKRVDTTRWSSRTDANRAFKKGSLPIKQLFFKISENLNCEAKMRNEALGFYKKMCSLEVGILAMFWNDVLDNLNKSKTLQNPKISMITAINALKSLKMHVESKKDKFEEYEKLGANLTGVDNYKHSRTRQRNVRLNPLDHEKSQ